MSALFFFSSDNDGLISGSSFGHSDGTKHHVELLETEGKMILRVKLKGMDDSVDLLFNKTQAESFASGVDGLMTRIR